MKKLINNRYWKETKFFHFKIGFLLMLIFISCEDYLEVGLPNSQLTSETVYEDAATAEAVLANVYSDLGENGFLNSKSFGISHVLGIYSDEMVYYGNANSIRGFFQNSLQPANPLIGSFWREGYNSIYVANVIIEGVQNSLKITKKKQDQLIGEGLFVRALNHFYLVNIFGDVPFITNTDYEVIKTVRRIPKKEVYLKIKEDLLKAKTLLSDEYITEERVRPNKWVVSALLSRVYLYLEEWQKAEAEASEIINMTSLFQLEGNLEDVFLKNSKSTIWQLHPGEQLISDAARTFIFSSGPPPMSALSESLINSFEPGDQRKSFWIGSVSNETGIWFYPYKYKQNSDLATVTEFSVIFRLAEIFLIRSEARARLGDLTGAHEDLNKIRKRAGLENIEASTQKELIDAIIQERRAELFTEFGNRFFGLKRTGRADKVFSLTKPGWEESDIFLPLPEAELLLNPNLLPQNPGY